MKVHQDKEFKPVVITLETVEEVNYLRSFIGDYYEAEEIWSSKRNFLSDLINILDTANGEWHE